MRPSHLTLAAALLAVSPLAACIDAPPPESTVASALDVCARSSDGALCNDGQPCTVNDVCVNKICVGTPAADGTACTDGNLCTINDVCVAAVCVGTVAPDGTPCSDDNACTDPDTCLAGRCLAGSAKTCDDGDPCTVDMCVPATGCVFSPRDCGNPPDATVDVSPPDVSLDQSAPDDLVSPPDVSLGDLGTDRSDAPGADAGPADASADASSDASSDAGADAAVAPPDFHVHGGACSCALDQSPAEAAWFLALSAPAIALGLRRRRQR